MSLVAINVISTDGVNYYTAVPTTVDDANIRYGTTKPRIIPYAVSLVPPASTTVVQVADDQTAVFTVGVQFNMVDANRNNGNVYTFTTVSSALNGSNTDITFSPAIGVATPAGFVPLYVTRTIPVTHLQIFDPEAPSLLNFYTAQTLATIAAFGPQLQIVTCINRNATAMNSIPLLINTTESIKNSKLYSDGIHYRVEYFSMKDQTYNPDVLIIVENITGSPTEI